MLVATSTLLLSAAAFSPTPATHGRSTVSIRSTTLRCTADAPLYCLNVELKVQPERRAEFLDCIRNNQDNTLASEPLAVTYLFGEDESTPNTFHFFEQYRGGEGFDAHTQTSHFAAWEAFAGTDPFSAPPRVAFYNADGPSIGGCGRHLDPHASLFSLAVRLRVKPERRSEFLDAIRVDRDGALASEALAVAYLFGEDVNEPNTFHMFEQYAGGREGFAAHAKTEHYQAWARFKETEPFEAPAKVDYYTTFEGTVSRPPWAQSKE